MTMMYTFIFFVYIFHECSSVNLLRPGHLPVDALDTLACSARSLVWWAGPGRVHGWGLMVARREKYIHVDTK